MATFWKKNEQKIPKFSPKIRGLRHIWQYIYIYIYIDKASDRSAAYIFGSQSGEALQDRVQESTNLGQEIVPLNSPSSARGRGENTLEL